MWQLVKTSLWYMTSKRNLNILQWGIKSRFMSTRVNWWKKKKPTSSVCLWYGSHDVFFTLSLSALALNLVCFICNSIFSAGNLNSFIFVSQIQYLFINSRQNNKTCFISRITLIRYHLTSDLLHNLWTMACNHNSTLGHLI